MDELSKEVLKIADECPDPIGKTLLRAASKALSDKDDLIAQKTARVLVRNERIAQQERRIAELERDIAELRVANERWAAAFPEAVAAE